VEIAGVETAEISFCRALPRAGEALAFKVELLERFSNAGEVGKAAGEASLRSFRGKVRFRIRVRGLPAGIYDLVIAGEDMGDIHLLSGSRERRDGSRQIRFALSPRVGRASRFRSPSHAGRDRAHDRCLEEVASAARGARLFGLALPSWHDYDEQRFERHYLGRHQYDDHDDRGPKLM